MVTQYDFRVDVSIRISDKSKCLYSMFTGPGVTLEDERALFFCFFVSPHQTFAFLPGDRAIIIHPRTGVSHIK